MLALACLIQPLQRRLFMLLRLIQSRPLLLLLRFLQSLQRFPHRLPRFCQRRLHFRILRLLHLCLRLFERDALRLPHHRHILRRSLHRLPRRRVPHHAPVRIHHLLLQFHQLARFLFSRWPRLCGWRFSLPEYVLKMPHLRKEHVAHRPPHLPLRPCILRPEVIGHQLSRQHLCPLQIQHLLHRLFLIGARHRMRKDHLPRLARQGHHCPTTPHRHIIPHPRFHRQLLQRGHLQIPFRKHHLNLRQRIGLSGQYHPRRLHIAPFFVIDQMQPIPTTFFKQERPLQNLIPLSAWPQGNDILLTGKQFRLQHWLVHPRLEAQGRPLRRRYFQGIFDLPLGQSSGGGRHDHHIQSLQFRINKSRHRKRLRALPLSFHLITQRLSHPRNHAAKGFSIHSHRHRRLTQLFAIQRIPDQLRLLRHGRRNLGLHHQSGVQFHLHRPGFHRKHQRHLTRQRSHLLHFSHRLHLPPHPVAAEFSHQPHHRRQKGIEPHIHPARRYLQPIPDHLGHPLVGSARIQRFSDHPPLQETRRLRPGRRPF